MPSELETWIDAIVIRGNQSYGICLNLMNHANALGDQLTAHNWEGAATAAYQMGNDFEDLRDYGHFRRVSGQYYNAIALYWINDNWPIGNGAEVTMKSILDAMWDSEIWQTLLFITRIDAMRGSISEKTVTEQAMADQLRHFI